MDVSLIQEKSLGWAFFFLLGLGNSESGWLGGGLGVLAVDLGWGMGLGWGFWDFEDGWGWIG